jgi:hypothetical protein
VSGPVYGPVSGVEQLKSAIVRACLPSLWPGVWR